MLKRVILGAVVAVVAVLGILVVTILMQPNEYSVSRSATMVAAPDKVFEQVSDFHKWDAWSPWAKLDPNMKTAIEGPAAGTGAVYSWTGNDEVGKGRMQIIEANRPQNVKIDLEFMEPMAGKSITDFNFKPAAGGTEVTWTMSGQHNFISKAMCLVMDMDKMIGPDFEKGLAQMKKVVETPAQ